MHTFVGFLWTSCIYRTRIGQPQPGYWWQTLKKNMQALKFWNFFFFILIRFQLFIYYFCCRRCSITLPNFWSTFVNDKDKIKTSIWRILWHWDHIWPQVHLGVNRYYDFDTIATDRVLDTIYGCGLLIPCVHLRATSHTSQEPWPWSCESPKESVQTPSQDTSKIM